MASETTPDAAARIDAVLADLPEEQRVALQAVREAIGRAAPTAEEGFSYGVPAYRYRGRPLAAYAAAAAHCSYFPMSPAVIDAHRAELAGFDLAKGTIRFQPGSPLSPALIASLVRTRVAEIDVALGNARA